MMEEGKGFEWRLPTRVLFGAGRLEELSHEIRRLGGPVLLIYGQEAMERAGVIARLKSLLAGEEMHFGAGVKPNLPLDDCDRLIEAVREYRPAVVVGIGGGSVLDGAKAAALIGPQKGGIRDWLAGEDGGDGLPFISIPTTAGTGSEVTPFIILFDDQARRKLSLARPQAFARTAIVDPELTFSLPKEQTIATALDALSHALESYWSRHATPLSDVLAGEAIPLILHHLEAVIQNPRCAQARSALSYAALLAGMALAQTATAALHGITYPLTAHYSIPHGIACAFLLREVMAINFHHLSSHRQKRLLSAFRAAHLLAALESLAALFERLQLPETFADLKIAAPDIELLAAEATAKNLERNIIPLSREKILALWEKKKVEGEKRV